MKNLLRCYDIYNTWNSKIICVTGCGPNLNKEHIPEGAFIIGVNRSFEKITPYIICTADERAYTYIKSIRKELVLFSIDMNLTIKDRVQFARRSGTFAIWIASLFNPDEIHLTGFGGEGHFYPDELSTLAEDMEELKRRNVPRQSFLGYKERTDAELLSDTISVLNYKIIQH